MNIKSYINDAIKYKNYEVITNGTFNGKVLSIEKSKTQKTNKDCIRYNIEIINSKGYPQTISIVETLKDEEHNKYIIGRLGLLLNELNVLNEENLDKINTLEELLLEAKKAINCEVSVEFIKKIVDGITIIDKRIGPKIN